MLSRSQRKRAVSRVASFVALSKDISFGWRSPSSELLARSADIIAAQGEAHTPPKGLPTNTPLCPRKVPHAPSPTSAVRRTSSPFGTTIYRPRISRRSLRTKPNTQRALYHLAAFPRPSAPDVVQPDSEVIVHGMVPLHANSPFASLIACLAMMFTASLHRLEASLMLHQNGRDLGGATPETSGLVRNDHLCRSRKQRLGPCKTGAGGVKQNGAREIAAGDRFSTVFAEK